jgi:hypothetical protein
VAICPTATALAPGAGVHRGQGSGGRAAANAWPRPTRALPSAIPHNHATNSSPANA